MTLMTPGVPVRAIPAQFPVPAFPTPEELGFPRMPPAPLGPEEDEALYSFGCKTYSDMREIYYASMSRSLERYKALILLTLRTLRSVEIPPAEWIRYRFGSYADHPLEDMNHPPITYVFSPTALAAELDRGELRWMGELSQPRVMAHKAARQVIKAWNEKRRQLVILATARSVTPADMHELWGHWTNLLEASRMAGRKIQETWEQQAAEGHYIWARSA